MTEIADEVTEARGDAGKNVWCPGGHGNRILDHGEKIGFPCPQCTLPMTTEEPPKVVGKTETVSLPIIGDLVVVRINPQTFRPALVLESNDDGRVFAHIFLAEGDARPPGLQTGQATLVYGNHIGGWQWSPEAPPGLTFEAVVPEDAD